MRRLHARTDGIQRELACPQCEYSLRGLEGDVVTCPECGLRCDLATMIAGQWTSPWHQAPGFSTLLWPVFCFVMGSFGLFVLRLNLIEERGSVTIPFYLALVTLVALWIALLYRAHRLLPHGEGLLLSLLAHGLFAGYLAGIIGFVWLVILQIRLPLLSMQSFINVLGLVAVAVFLLTCRWGEKYIARQCIRAYLIRSAAGTGRVG